MERIIRRTKEFDELYFSLPKRVMEKIMNACKKTGASLPTFNDYLSEKYGEIGTRSRELFEAKAKAWYYAEILRNARKSAGITQQQLADRIGKKREYIASLERGETDMQLSTFILITEAVGLRLSLM